MRKLIASARFFLEKKQTKEKKAQKTKKNLLFTNIHQEPVIANIQSSKKKIILRCGWLKFVDMNLNLVSLSLGHNF